VQSLPVVILLDELLDVRMQMIKTARYTNSCSLRRRPAVWETYATIFARRPRTSVNLRCQPLTEQTIWDFEDMMAMFRCPDRHGLNRLAMADVNWISTQDSQ